MYWYFMSDWLSLIPETSIEDKLAAYSPRTTLSSSIARDAWANPSSTTDIVALFWTPLKAIVVIAANTAMTTITINNSTSVKPVELCRK